MQFSGIVMNLTEQCLYRFIHYSDSLSGLKRTKCSEVVRSVRASVYNLIAL